jgi:hypothetical protein
MKQPIRTAVVTTRVSPDERRRWHEAAVRSGLDLSELLRLAMTGYLRTLTAQIAAADLVTDDD